MKTASLFLVLFAFLLAGCSGGGGTLTTSNYAQVGQFMTTGGDIQFTLHNGGVTPIEMGYKVYAAISPSNTSMELVGEALMPVPPSANMNQTVMVPPTGSRRVWVIGVYRNMPSDPISICKFGSDIMPGPPLVCTFYTTLGQQSSIMISGMGLSN